MRDMKLYSGFFKNGGKRDKENSTQRELDISKNASKFLEKVENRFIGIFHLFVFTTFAILQKLPLGVAPLAHTHYIL